MNDLFDYLDVSGPEYAYLGHFRASEYLECGHNTTGDAADIEQTINQGQIPDLKTGRNFAADAEPTDISSESSRGMTPPSSSMSTPGPMGSKTGGGLGSTLGNAAIGTAADYVTGNTAQDFSSVADEEAGSSLGATFGQNLASQGGLGKALAGVFGV